MENNSQDTSRYIKTDEEILQEQIQEYILTLNEREKLVLEIAHEHLQSSFCIERSVGFVKWKKSKIN